MTPKILLGYWNQKELPAWRRDCIRRLRILYPDAVMIWRKALATDGPHDSDIWRVKMCGQYERCLWVDSDIYLDSPLELTERPAMADEYKVRHWSIIWSGLTPLVFVGKRVCELANDFRIEKIKITGTHYVMSPDGSKSEKLRY